jgi:5'-3' exonuclease
MLNLLFFIELVSLVLSFLKTRISCVLGRRRSSTSLISKLILLNFDVYCISPRDGQADLLDTENLQDWSPPPVDTDLSPKDQKKMQSEYYFVLDVKKMTPEQFVRTCILSGCDYLDSLPGIGLKTAIGYVLRFRDYPDSERMLKFILSKKNHRPEDPQQYIKDFHGAERTFFHQLVFDPRNNSITRLNPMPNEKVREIEEECRSLSERPFISMDIGNVLMNSGKDVSCVSSQSNPSTQSSQPSSTPSGWKGRDSSDPMEIEDDFETPLKKMDSPLQKVSQDVPNSDDVFEEVLSLGKTESPPTVNNLFQTTKEKCSRLSKQLRHSSSSSSSQSKPSLYDRLKQAQTLVTPVRPGPSKTKREPLSSALAKKCEENSKSWTSKYTSAESSSQSQDKENLYPLETGSSQVSSVASHIIPQFKESTPLTRMNHSQTPVETAREKDHHNEDDEEDEVLILDETSVTPAQSRKRSLLTMGKSSSSSSKPPSSQNKRFKKSVSKKSKVGLEKSPSSVNKILAYFDYKV